MLIFNFNDYRHFIRAFLEDSSRSPHGSMGKIAGILKIKPSYLSQVLSGSKNLSQEQAYGLAQHLKLDAFETQFLYLLVNLSRANSANYKKSIVLEMKKLKAEVAAKKGERSNDHAIDEKKRALFYSSWQYSAVHLASGISGSQTAEQISERLKIDVRAAIKILTFLVDCGLCSRDDTRFYVGLQNTHLPKDSALNSRNQTNWRMRALDSIAESSKENLFYTASMRIDEMAFQTIKEILTLSTSEITRTVNNAGDTTLACVNVDCFKL